MRIQAFDFSINLMRSILWQYESAPRAIQLSQNDQDWLEKNQTDFWNDWYTDVFNVDTANSFGLSVWAEILGLRLEIDVQPNIFGVFGFGEFNKNFENGGFGTPADETASLDSESARKLIKLRWFQLTMRPSVKNINEALNNVFGPGKAFVIDGYDMSMNYVFNEEPDYKLRRLLENTDILPRPSTVKVGWTVVPRKTFGFEEYHYNFENGGFAD